VAEAQGTASSCTNSARVGSGAAWTDQLAPSHVSTRARDMPALSVELPTAVQAAVDMHETLSSPL
jgi:hypothetical protein